MDKKRRYFPDEFKRQAAERVETSGLSVMNRQFGKAGTASARRPLTPAQAPSPADLAAENARLKRELQRAQTERDTLKKAALIFGAATR